MGRQLELPENVYAALMRAAAEHGQSPEEWIAARVPVESNGCEPGDKDDEDASEPSLLERMEGFIGVIDSHEEPNPHRPSTAFGESIALKLSKQGITRPWQP